MYAICGFNGTEYLYCHLEGYYILKWDATHMNISMFNLLFYSEDRGSTILQNISQHLPDLNVIFNGTLLFTITTLFKPYNFQWPAKGPVSFFPIPGTDWLLCSSLAYSPPPPTTTTRPYHNLPISQPASHVMKTEVEYSSEMPGQ
jgi:hypothetical protein